MSRYSSFLSSFLKYSTNPKDFLLNLNGINGKTGMVQPNAYLTPKNLIDIKLVREMWLSGLRYVQLMNLKTSWVRIPSFL